MDENIGTGTKEIRSVNRTRTGQEDLLAEN